MKPTKRNIYSTFVGIAIGLLFLNWTSTTNSIQWTILDVDTLQFGQIFNDTQMTKTEVTGDDAQNTIQLIVKDFESIKSELHLDNSKNFESYRYQLVGALNRKNEKIVFVNGFGFDLPNWTHNDWKTKLVTLKCTGDKLICFKVNLTHQTFFQATKSECE